MMVIKMAMDALNSGDPRLINATKIWLKTTIDDGSLKLLRAMVSAVNFDRMRPYALAMMGENKVEIISYPFDNNGYHNIMVRTIVGDPMSMIEVSVENIIVDD